MGWDIPEDFGENNLDASKLTIEAQQSLMLFNTLPDKIDGMGAGWYGKDYASLEFIMDLLKIEDKYRVFELLSICTNLYMKYAHEKSKQ